MATQGQLRKLSLNKRCKYLDYDESSVGGGSVPFFNGGLQMFGPNCGFQKVGEKNHTNRTPTIYSVTRASYSWADAPYRL